MPHDKKRKQLAINRTRKEIERFKRLSRKPPADLMAKLKKLESE